MFSRRSRSNPRLSHTRRGRLLAALPGRVMSVKNPFSWFLWFSVALPLIGCQELIADSQNNPNPLAVDDHWVYWTAYQSSTGAGLVLKASKAGGGSPMTIATNPDDEESVSVGGGHLCWLAGYYGGRIVTASTSGGTPVTVAVGQSASQCVVDSEERLLDERGQCPRNHAGARRRRHADHARPIRVESGSHRARRGRRVLGRRARL